MRLLSRWCGACGALIALGLCALAGSVRARPEAPSVFCQTYAQGAECLGRVVQCTMCHESTFPPSWNKYGLSILAAMPSDVSFAEGLPQALAAVEDKDADGDGESNVREIMTGTYPGDASSLWLRAAAQSGPDNPAYKVDEYDLAFAYRRAVTLYCGQSPAYDEMQAFRAKDARAADLRQMLHERVSACLDAPYWQQEGLKRLGDNRIRPAKNAGAQSEVLLGGRRLVIGDYDYDYRLWVHALTGDRDARDLLLAQYYVKENGELTEERILKTDDTAIAGGQPLDKKEQRAGMLTTQWFLARNTMFSQLPRTSAAAAYRAYLGMDIAQTQGLSPVPGEPDDVDKKGVKEARCASCHSTLDPLSYAFVRYEGIASYRGGQFGSYDEARAQRLIPGWSDAEQQPVIFGQNVSSLREWAEVAANSDAFARNLAQLFFEHALSRGPTPDELTEFTALWRGLPDDKYSANRLIHRLIDSRAFGVP